MKRLSYNKGAVVGGILFLLVLLAAVFAPLLAPFDYAEINIQDRCMSPCLAHLFGTDQMGRDILSRALYGARYSMIIGIGSVVFSAVFGIIIGAIAGYYGGWLDNFIMRLCDIIQSIPGLILNIALACALGPGIFNIILALGIEGIAGTARLMRSSILNVRKMEYLDAARTSNCGNYRIILKHVFPNTFAPILVQSTMGVGSRIMLAASMSYVGIGVQPPTPEWGAMLADSRDFLMEYPYMCLIPGICIMVVVLALNLLGDGLRDALDPKLKK
ncbi:ABC transporter permease [Mediterraneibacter sp. NSJ-55]|uniref:ABC transporter permease n=2 Tax=Mediterraneibacter hominis TaxID=2763054 RepID=A0A923LGT4_9FIRM|nr:ABC transporter permease [Mediterraneibacter hominis]